MNKRVILFLILCAILAVTTASAVVALQDRGIGQLISGTTSSGALVSVLVDSSGNIGVTGAVTVSGVSLNGPCPVTTTGQTCTNALTIQGSAVGVPVPTTTPQGTPLLVLGAGISTASASTITSTVQTVLSSPAVLNSIRCGSEAATALDWIQIHDTTGAVTVGTTVPKDSVPVPPTNAGGAIQLNYTLSNGLKIAATTTAAGATTASQAIDWCTFTYRSLTNGQ